MEIFNSDDLRTLLQMEADAILLEDAVDTDYAKQDLLFARARELIARQALDHEQSPEAAELTREMLESAILDRLDAEFRAEYVDAELARLSLACL